MTMKWALVLLCLMSVVVGGLGATATAIRRDPTHPGSCTLKPDVVLPQGGTTKDPDAACGIVYCGEEGVATFTTCDPMEPPPNCKFGDYKDASLNYPACCTRNIICVK